MKPPPRLLLPLLLLLMACAAPATGLTNTTECWFRSLTYAVALQRQPWRAPLNDVFDALQLASSCAVAPLPPAPPPRPPAVAVPPSAVFADPIRGADSNPGSQQAPVRTVQAALALARQTSPPRAVVLRQGTYFLNSTLMLGSQDSGLILQNYPGEAAWLSGGVPLSTSWQPHKPSTRSCRARCGTSGQDVGLMAGEPSCVSGCEFAARTSSAEECEAACWAAVGACDYAVGDYTARQCQAGLDVSKTIATPDRCLAGCRVASGAGIFPDTGVG